MNTISEISAQNSRRYEFYDNFANTNVKDRKRFTSA